MGCAVIATRCSGVTEQILDGVNGVICENEESAIVGAMGRLLTEPDTLSELRNDFLPPALLDDRMKLERLESLVP